MWKTENLSLDTEDEQEVQKEVVTKNNDMNWIVHPPRLIFGEDGTVLFVFGGLLCQKENKVYV